MASDDLIDTAKAAGLLGVSQRRVRQLIAAGRLRAKTIAGNFIIRRADLQKVRVRKPGRPKKKG
jgi:excisionase family DNA binding protein